jgi:hypothetical protein
MSAGKSGGGESTTFDYFGTCAALVCVGPVSGLWAVILDGKQVYPVDDETGEPLTEVRRPGVGTNANGADSLDVPGLGIIWFYWGSETQLADPVLNANTEGEIHPAYRGYCYMVLDNWLLGRERQEAPNLEVIVERAPCRLNADGSAIVHDDLSLSDGQANPLAVVQEALLDPRFGFDLRVSDLNVDDWADAFAVVGMDARNYVSCLIDSQQTARALASDLGDYGEFRVVGNGRKFGAVAWRREGQDINVGTLPVITAGQLAEAPRITRNLPASLPNQWQLIYSDRGRRFGRDAVRSALLDARAVPGGLRPDSLDRPFITIRGQAQGWLDSFISRRGRPRRAVSLVVRRGFAASLRPGDVFRLDVDLEPGGTQVLIVVRIDRVILPAGNRPAQVEATEELAFAPVTISIVPGTDATPLALPALPKWTRVLQCPPLLVDYDVNRLTTLLAREDDMTLGHGAYIRVEPDFTAVLIGWQRQLAIRGTLVANLAAPALAADGGGELRADLLTVESSFDVLMSRRRWNAAAPGIPDGLRDENFLLDSDPGPEAANNNDLLAILVQCTSALNWNDPAIDAGTKYKLVEFCSIETTADVTVNPLTATFSTWRLGVLRGRLGWPARSFLASDPVEVWIVRRADLPAWQHRLLILNTEINWRLTPFNAFAARDVSAIDPAPTPGWRAFDFGAPAYAPAIEFLAPTPADNAGLSATQYTAAVKVTDRDGNLARIEVVFYKLGDPEPAPFSKVLGSIGPDYILEPVYKFTPGTSGSYRLEVRAWDTADFQRVAFRNYTVAGGAACLSPFVHSQLDSARSAKAVWFVLATTGTGSEVYYSNVPLGAAAGSFALWNGSLIVITQNRTFYVYGHKGGLSDSPTLRYDIYLQFGGGNLTP